MYLCIAIVTAYKGFVSCPWHFESGVEMRGIQAIEIKMREKHKTLITTSVINLLVARLSYTQSHTRSAHIIYTIYFFHLNIFPA